MDASALSSRDSCRAARRAGGSGRARRRCGYPLPGRRSSSCSCRVLERLGRARVDEVVVVAGAYPLELDGVRVAVCPDWEHGPGASLRCGLSALPSGTEAAVVVLADGPDLAPEAVDRILEAWRAGAGPLVAASYGGERGHPLLLARELWQAVPDEGLRALQPVLVPATTSARPATSIGRKTSSETQAAPAGRPHPGLRRPRPRSRSRLRGLAAARLGSGRGQQGDPRFGPALPRRARDPADNADSDGRGRHPDPGRDRHEHPLRAARRRLSGRRRRLLRGEPPTRVGGADKGRARSEAVDEETGPSSFRVDFSRGDDCLSLLTYGMAPGHVGEPTFVLSVESGDGPCPDPNRPSSRPLPCR